MLSRIAENRYIAGLTPVLFFTKTLISLWVLLAAMTIGRVMAGAWDEGTGAVLSPESLFQPQQVRLENIYNMFERYERGMNESQIRERLDGFAIFLEYNPNYRADIMAYGGRRSCRGEALKRAQLATEYLTNEKGISAARIAISDGGYREKWAVELWKGVDGSARPFSMLTIDRNKVKIINNCRITR